MPQFLRNLQVTSCSPLPHTSCPEKATKPFLKWPGGKRWIAKELAHVIAARLSYRYYEPFLGGGAVFFALHPKDASLSDINVDLINVYRQVRDNPDEILTQLEQMPVTRSNYYRIRGDEPECPIERATRFLYLNRTAFGGIYRLNQKGKFNVPYGGGERTPELLWRDNLIKSASKVIQGIELVTSDFEKIIDRSGPGDTVYCDPTYTVAHENNGFIRYNERNFSWVDQKRLASASIRACERGALVIVSNANHSSLQELYKPFKPLQLKRKSLVSPKSEARREVYESLFILDPETL